MTNLDSGYDERDLAVLKPREEVQPLPVEKTREQKKAELLRMQETKIRKVWDNLVGSIIKKERKGHRLEIDLKWFVEKAKKTSESNDGLGSGGWTRMIEEVVSDSESAKLIDKYREVEGTRFIENHAISEKRTKTLKKIVDEKEGVEVHAKDKMYQRVEFLEKLLETTRQHFVPLDKEQRDAAMEQVLVSIWSDVLARFREIRAHAMRERLEQLLPDIDQIKEDVAAYLEKEFPAFVSEAGIQRVRHTDVMIGFDEYLEAGAGWGSAGSYNVRGKRVEIGGKTSLSPELRKAVSVHELTHVASGHGEMEEADQSTEPGRGLEHIQSVKRIGISGKKGEHRWLNEAVTEMIAGRIAGIPEERLTYPTERAYLKEGLERVVGVKEEDILKWYFAEGDDTIERERLNALYPTLFSKLDRIQALVRERKSMSFERLGSEDFKRITKIFGE